MAVDAAWIERFRDCTREVRRERLLDDYRRDTLLIQEGRRAANERLMALAGRERYEPDTEVPDGD